MNIPAATTIITMIFHIKSEKMNLNQPLFFQNEAKTEINPEIYAEDFSEFAEEVPQDAEQTTPVSSKLDFWTSSYLHCVTTLTN